jgi:vanillate/4-hydroxybenzoate decarboxylase subunit D
MQSYPRPDTLRVYVDKVDADGTCPECGADELKSYPVLSEGGWWDVTKCQQCLHSVSREPGPLLGGISMLVDAI